MRISKDTIESGEERHILLEAARIIRERGLRRNGIGSHGRKRDLAGAITEAAGEVTEYSMVGHPKLFTRPSALRAWRKLATHLGLDEPAQLVLWSGQPERTGEEVAAACEAAARG